jgi:hypothetical protein
MRKLVLLAAIGALAWWLLGRNKPQPGRATIGFTDGSSVTLEAGSPELERLVEIAAGVAST